MAFSSNILINDCMIAVTASVSKAIEWDLKKQTFFHFQRILEEDIRYVFGRITYNF